MDVRDQRLHPRMQYFLLLEEQGPVPYFSFRDDADVEATPALVVDLSLTGVQILTNPGATLDAPCYRLDLLWQGNRTPATPTVLINRVWDAPHGLYTRIGFAFAAPNDERVRQWMAQLDLKPSAAVRCVLYTAEAPAS